MATALDTVASAAETIGVMQLALGACQERTALWDHIRSKGELLAVENEHVAVLNKVFLAITALAKC